MQTLRYFTQKQFYLTVLLGHHTKLPYFDLPFQDRQVLRRLCQVPQVQFVEKIVEVPEVRIQEVQNLGGVNQPSRLLVVYPVIFHW